MASCMRIVEFVFVLVYFSGAHILDDLLVITAYG